MAVQLDDEAALYNYFKQVDSNHSGQITAVELQRALRNGPWAPFNLETARLMINMLDRDYTGAMGFSEFKELWSSLATWQNTFKAHDRNSSGTIDRNELKIVLTNFGYNLTDSFYNVLMRRFERQGLAGVTFGDFIECCILLRAQTDLFRRFDEDQNGWIQVDYEQFLTLILSY